MCYIDMLRSSVARACVVARVRACLCQAVDHVYRVYRNIYSKFIFCSKLRCLLYSSHLQCLLFITFL